MIPSKFHQNRPRGSRDMCKNMRSIKGRTKGKIYPLIYSLLKTEGWDIDTRSPGDWERLMEIDHAWYRSREFFAP